jgi:septal ring-binding cell division protein DamX
MAKDRFKTEHASPWVVRIVIGILLLAAIGLLATYVLRPGRSPADDAQTAEAIRKMDQAQAQADAKRDEQRSATSLL